MSETTCNSCEYYDSYFGKCLKTKEYKHYLEDICEMYEEFIV